MRIAIGVPIHNGGQHLGKALDALKRQSHADFRCYLLDDGSTDDSYRIASEYASADARMILSRNERRTGMVAAWQRVVQIAAEHGDVDWFAWYSDHDHVANDWLERMLAVAQRVPNAVLVHPRTVHVGADGRPTGKESDLLDTVGQDGYERLRRVAMADFSAGDAVYGLIRFDALLSCGVFPAEIMPDRLLVSELALHGSIVSVPETIRFRLVSAELDKIAMVERQLRNLFGDAEAPEAPWVSHVTYFLRRALACQPADVDSDLRRIYHALSYFQRHLNRFRDRCDQEVSHVPPDSPMAPVYAFVNQAMDRNWRFLYQDYAGALRRMRSAQQKARALKLSHQKHQDVLSAKMRAISDRASAEVAAARNKLAELDEARAQAKSELKELKAAIDILERERVAANQRIEALQSENSKLMEEISRPFRLAWRHAWRMPIRSAR